MLVQDSEDRVGAHEIVRPHRRADAVAELPRQMRRVDGNRAVEPGEARIHAAVDRMQIDVDILGEIGLGAGTGGARSGRRRRRREQGAVIAVVIEDAGRFGGAAGELCQEAGE